MYGKIIIWKFYNLYYTLILINEDHSNIYFLGNTNEIILCQEVGLYEIVEYEDVENRSECFSIFSYSYLLSPEPLLKYFIRDIPVYVLKCTPFEIEL